MDMTPPGFADWKHPPVSLRDLEIMDARAREALPAEQWDAMAAPGGRYEFTAHLLTNQGGGSYTFEEVVVDDSGAIDVPSDGISGTALELNYNSAIATEDDGVTTVIRIFPTTQNGAGWGFLHCCTSTISTVVPPLSSDTPSLDLLSAGPGPVYSLTSTGPVSISSIPIPPDLPDGYQITLINANRPDDPDNPAPFVFNLLNLAADGVPPGRFDLPGLQNAAIAPGTDVVLRVASDGPGGERVWHLASSQPPASSGSAPPAITGTPTATSGDGSVYLTWTASAGPPPSTLYLVYMSLSSDMSDPTLVGVVPADNPFGLALQVPGLADGVARFFAIAAVGALGGIAGLSPIVSATPAASRHLFQLARLEAGDTLSSAATVKRTGTLSVTEADDTLSAAGTVKRTGTLSVTEAGDTLSATGTVTGGSPPPCSTSNGYTCVVSGVTGVLTGAVNATYNMTFTGNPQEWNVTNTTADGDWTLTMELGGPYTLTFNLDGTDYAVYTASSFDCVTGGTFSRTSFIGGSWPSTLTVTLT